jgi:hypothetical protein
MTKRKRTGQPRTEYMSIREAIAFLDGFASAHVPDTPAEVNLALLARSVTRVLDERGRHVGDPIRQVAKWLAVGSRSGGGHGRPPELRDECRAMIQDLHRLHPPRAWYVVTRRVADHFHIPVRRVRRHGEHEPSLRW